MKHDVHWFKHDLLLGWLLKTTEKLRVFINLMWLIRPYMLRVFWRFFNPTQYRLSSKLSDFRYKTRGGTRNSLLCDWPSALHACHFAETTWNNGGLFNPNDSPLGTRSNQVQYKKRSSFSLTYKVYYEWRFIMLTILNEKSESSFQRGKRRPTLIGW